MLVGTNHRTRSRPRERQAHSGPPINDGGELVMVPLFPPEVLDAPGSESAATLVGLTRGCIIDSSW